MLAIRERVSVTICVISAVVAAVLIKLGYSPSKVLLGVATVWSLVAEWLRDRRKTKGLMTSNVSQVYEAARRGDLKQSPLARVITGGFLALVAASIVCLFV